MLLVLYSSKMHDKSSKPQEIKISGSYNSIRSCSGPTRGAAALSQKLYCPFRLIRTYLKIRGEFIDKQEQLIVFADHNPVHPEHIRKVLRVLLESINLDSSMYDMHSLRAGRAVDMQKFGYSLDAIR